MPSGDFLFVFSICLFSSALSAWPTPPSNGLTMTSTPTTMHQDFTKDLTLTCAYRQPPGQLFSIMSLILSKVDSNEVPSEIAAIRSLFSNNVTVMETLNAHVTGQLVNNGQSSISYQWTYPTEDVVGEYRCEVLRMDVLGHHLVTSVSANVSGRNVDHDAILERIKQLDLNTHAQLASQKSQIDDQKNQLVDQQKEIDQQRSELNDVLSRLGEYQDAIIQFSSTFRGHRYLLSRRIWRETTVYDGMCRLFGGYLTEVDDQQEYDFVYSFLVSKSLSELVFISGTDEGNEGTWTHQRQGDQMSYFNWGGADPSNGAGEDCMMLYPTRGWKMYDNYCRHQDWMRFLCEVPS